MIELRPMTLSDVPQVVVIEKAAVEDPWTDSIFSDCMLVGYECWVFSRKDEVLGYGIMSADGHEAHVLNLGIKETARRLGLGERMMRKIMKLSMQKGASKLLLEVRLSNEPAIALYKKLNFKYKGIRKDYYKTLTGHEDAMLFEIGLNN